MSQITLAGLPASPVCNICLISLKNYSIRGYANRNLFFQLSHVKIITIFPLNNYEPLLSEAARIRGLF